jgi:hypothetical protein
MGKRTLSHLVFGDSHRLDAIPLPEGFPGWEISDVRIEGGNVVRMGGRFTIETPFASYHPCWTPPGLFLWDWQIAQIKMDAFEVGDSLLLIENPYPMWELMLRDKDQKTSYVCLHGETLRSKDCRIADALRSFLKIVLLCKPGLPVKIWSDPDPAGLIIASNAYSIVTDLGGCPEFHRMDPEVLDEISSSVLLKPGLKVLTETDQQLLSLRVIHPFLSSLADKMKANMAKGEQEIMALPGEVRNAQ